MTSARESLLDCARDLVVSGTWSRTSLAEVAAGAGVSRQTLYNEFGSRDGLMAAVAARAADRFRAGTLAAARGEADPADAIGAAMTWAISAARADPLVAAGFRDDVGGLLPYLTNRSTDVLVPIATDLAAWLDRPEAPWACEVALRLTVSHLLTPLQQDAAFVDAATELIRPLFQDAP